MHDDPKELHRARPGPAKSSIKPERLASAVQHLQRRIDRVVDKPCNHPQWRLYASGDVLWLVLSPYGTLEIDLDELRLVSSVPQRATLQHGGDSLTTLTNRLWSMRKQLKRLPEELREALEPFASIFNA